MTGQKIAVDIGTKNITVYVEGKGISVCQPPCILIDSNSKKIVAAGMEALKYQGKHNKSLEMIYPILNGRITDYKRAVYLFKKYIDIICRGRLLRPNVMICVPENLSVWEKKAISDAVAEAGAGRVIFADRALAASAGAGNDIYDYKGHIVCDIGSTYTQCSVVASGKIVMSETREIGSEDFNNSLKEYLLRTKNIIIPDSTAEELKKNLGSVIQRDEEIAIEICGKDSITAYPSNTEITSTEIRNTFRKNTEEICDIIRLILESVSPELCSDILDSGILLTGEAADLFGLDLLISKSTGIKTVKPESPELCAALGMGKLLENYNFHKD